MALSAGMAERGRAEEALRESEADLREMQGRMQLAADAAHLGMWEWDIVRDEIWAQGESRMRLSAVKSDRLDFNRVLQSLHPDDRDAVTQAVARSMNGDGDFESEHRFVLPGGQTRWVAAHGRVEFNDEHKPIRMHGVSMDISARKLAEEEARRHREEISRLTRVGLLGEMSASIAHELNQPLSGIVSNASAGQRFIDRGDADLHKLREIMVDITADGRRAGEVIRNIRNTVKRGATSRQRLNLNDVIMSVARMVHPDALAHSCQLKTSLTKDLPTIEADPVQIQQVLINLFGNAFDAMRDTPVRSRKVEVATERSGNGTILVSVRDHGAGIPDEARKRLFEQFFTTKEQGLGMGLAIVRSIIEAHGGAIAAENAGGGGARFYFTLPDCAAKSKNRYDASNESKHACESGDRVLVWRSG
jgi:C4-dicarboxylate-specific signal transduction histidine kinase